MDTLKRSAFLQNNSEVVKTLSKNGLIPASVLTEWNIYIFYSGLTAKSKMQKYQDTAEAMRVSEKTVRNAVKSMEKNI